MDEKDDIPAVGQGRNEAPDSGAGDSVEGGPAAVAGAAPGDDTEALRQALEAAQAEAATYKDQMLRALAEAENVRRRTQREREELGKYANAGFAKELLPVADNLRRALDAIPAEALAGDEALRSLKEGVELTERQLMAAFERNNIRRFAPLGEKFDSHLHQAVFEVPGSGQPPGTVVQVLEAGYMLHDRLLRPAMVGVAKADPPKNGAGTGAPAANGADPPTPADSGA